jgi:hypothetical protein
VPWRQRLRPVPPGFGYVPTDVICPGGAGRTLLRKLAHARARRQMRAGPRGWVTKIPRGPWCAPFLHTLPARNNSLQKPCQAKCANRSSSVRAAHQIGAIEPLAPAEPLTRMAPIAPRVPSGSACALLSSRYETFDEPLWDAAALQCLQWGHPPLSRMRRAPAPPNAVTPTVCSALADAYGFSTMALSFVMGAAAMGLVWVWASAWRAWRKACIATLRRAPPLPRVAPSTLPLGGTAAARSPREVLFNARLPSSSSK